MISVSQLYGYEGKYFESSDLIEKHLCLSKHYFMVFSQNWLILFYLFYFLLFLYLIHGLHNKHFSRNKYNLSISANDMKSIDIWINKVNLVFLRTKNSTTKSMYFCLQANGKIWKLFSLHQNNIGSFPDSKSQMLTFFSGRVARLKGGIKFK